MLSPQVVKQSPQHKGSSLYNQINAIGTAGLPTACSCPSHLSCGQSEQPASKMCRQHMLKAGWGQAGCSRRWGGSRLTPELPALLSSRPNNLQTDHAHVERQCQPDQETGCSVRAGAQRIRPLSELGHHCNAPLWWQNLHRSPVGQVYIKDQDTCHFGLCPLA